MGRMLAHGLHGTTPPELALWEKRACRWQQFGLQESVTVVLADVQAVLVYSSWWRGVQASVQTTSLGCKSGVLIQRQVYVVERT